MNNIPERINLANLPTKIEKSRYLSKMKENLNVFVKRDDYTGIEVSGNKIRKLEFSVKQALDEGCNALITCGATQSNHARATAAVAAKLGLKSYLILRGKKEDMIDGNYLLDKMLGANIIFVNEEEYKNRQEIMEELVVKLKGDNIKAYIIPEGASNGIGTFGYYGALEEILKQEKELGIIFDTIVCAVGSGGTYAGLFLANKVFKANKKIYGVNVSKNAQHFINQVENLLKDANKYISADIEYSKDEINIMDGYVGKGYGISTDKELSFIRDIACNDGIIFDPVYTGKAVYGMVNEIKKNTFNESKNILFIHTGGLFGLMPKREQFIF
ncbi:D-cysteine desulfhydrase family protein [Abyssisolibacter fermentans]|uniref:D-cysteine desulfhydrase family protein n=1 Tax=Abyssisolibacter fermentans TaxID=1766203 RepID=UPI00082C8752|nr:D-cysteine desulfhydrase family protein [Abyssisolibacter fermentans]